MVEVPPVPPGYHSVTPYLIVAGAAAAIEFYKKAFGASERMRLAGPGGRVGHAEITINGSAVMLADEHPEIGARGPRSVGGSPVSLHLYLADVDRTLDQAVAAGAKLVRPAEDKFYGDRLATIEDPFGHTWHLATRREHVPAGELRRRAEAAAQGGQGT